MHRSLSRLQWGEEAAQADHGADDAVKSGLLVILIPPLVLLLDELDYLGLFED